MWQPDYVTTAELKSFVRISDSDDDVEVALAVTTASRSIDRFANRQFGQEAGPVERFYTAEFDHNRRRWVVSVDDFMVTAGLAVAFDEVGDETYSAVIDSYSLQPVNSSANGRPWTRILVRSDSATLPNASENAVRVTAQFGWTSVPEAIKQATLLQASRLLARRDSPYGIAGSPELGSEIRLLARLDPDVEVAVAPYRRMWGAV